MKEDKAKCLDEDIRAIARALAGVYERSCAVLKPIVDDACKFPASVDENELEHIFDWVLNVSCCRKGKRMFDRLCKTFSRVYPGCVRDYIKADQEMYGDESSGVKPNGTTMPVADSHFSTKVRIGEC